MFLILLQYFSCRLHNSILLDYEDRATIKNIYGNTAMLMQLMHLCIPVFLLLFLFVIYQTLTLKVQPVLSSYNDEFEVKIHTKKIDRMKYFNGEVLIYQNEEKTNEFYFTPFPYLQPSVTLIKLQ